MSLNSLQDNMSRRAASMAAMAKRATNPQDIQAIQKSLVDGVQNGSIQPYVGIPLIQELTQKLTEAKAQMAQSMAGAGMQQAPQGAPIAQQVMQQAAQESQGLEALPSNLPQEYAGGGIIAFEEGGEVERYQDQGLVGSSPAGRFFSGLGQSFSEQQEAAKLRNKLQMKYGPRSAMPGLFMNQSDAERQTAKDITGRLPTMTLSEMQALYDQGPSALPPVAVASPVVTPTATPAAVPLAPPPAAAKPSAPAAPAISGAGKFVPPTLKEYTPTILTLPERTLPTKTDFAGFIKDAPKEAQTAFDTARTKEEDYLRNLTKPGDEAREKKFNEREAAQDKDSAMGRALNLMNLGFGIAGSKERSIAGALGKEGREGIADLIRGEAANRVAKERLADARDNFEQQKIAAAKGDRSAANAAGQRAAEDKRAYTQLNLQALQAGSSEANQRFQLEQTGDFNKLSANNQGQQLQLSAVDSANRNKVGIAGLAMQDKQLNQNAAIAKANLAAQEKRFNAMDDANKARIMQATAKGLSDFMQNEGAQLKQQLAKDYGPNFLTAQDARSLEGKMKFNQQRDAYLAIIKGQAIDALSARQADALLGQ